MSLRDIANRTFRGSGIKASATVLGPSQVSTGTLGKGVLSLVTEPNWSPGQTGSTLRAGAPVGGELVVPHGTEGERLLGKGPGAELLFPLFFFILHPFSRVSRPLPPTAVPLLTPSLFSFGHSLFSDFSRTSNRVVSVFL